MTSTHTILVQTVTLLACYSPHIVEPLYKGHTGTMKIVLYTEVSFIQKLTKVLAWDQNKCPL